MEKDKCCSRSGWKCCAISFRQGIWFSISFVKEIAQRQLSRLYDVSWKYDASNEVFYFRFSWVLTCPFKLLLKRDFIFDVSWVLTCPLNKNKIHISKQVSFYFFNRSSVQQASEQVSEVFCMCFTSTWECPFFSCFQSRPAVHCQPSCRQKAPRANWKRKNENKKKHTCPFFMRTCASINGK